MMTRNVKIRRHLRAARVSALTQEERREELRVAEQLAAQKESRLGQTSAGDPAPPPESRAGTH